MYYSTANAKYDLSVVLNRAGVRWFFSFDHNAYRAESRYISRYAAIGSTQEEALDLFGNKIQESRNWHLVAREFLGESSKWVAAEDVNNPTLYWGDIVVLFEAAYQEPQDFGAISRIYAYAEQCHSQREEVDGEDLPSTVLGAFYERIPTIPNALLDMPRWFTFEEIEDWLVNSPFIVDWREDMLRVFSRI